MDFVCLNYHQVSDDPVAGADPFTVSVACFKAQMDWLAQHGFVGVSVGKAQDPGGGSTLPTTQNRQVALTFDDGYRDFYTTAWPILKELGFGATLFLVSGRMGKTANWPGSTPSPLLTGNEARELLAQGVEIAAHGHTHQALDDLTSSAVLEELQLARQWQVDELGRAPAGLAYPYGRWSPSVAQSAQQAGFQWAVTTRGGVNRYQTPKFKLRRTQLTGRDCGKMGRWRFAIKMRTGYATMVEWRMDLRRVP